MRSNKDDRKQRRSTASEDRSASLVSNLSEFRSPTCHHFDFASMGMHPKLCKLRVLPVNLKTLPTWIPCLVRGDVFLGVEAVLSTGAILEAVTTVYCRGKQCLQEHFLVTGAKLCRQEPCCGDRSNPGGCPCRQGQDVVD